MIPVPDVLASAAPGPLNAVFGAPMGAICPGLAGSLRMGTILDPFLWSAQGPSDTSVGQYQG